MGLRHKHKAQGGMSPYQEGAAVTESKQTLSQTMDTVNHSSVSGVLSEQHQALLLLVGHQLVVDQADFLCTNNDDCENRGGKWRREGRYL